MSGHQIAMTKGALLQSGERQITPPLLECLSLPLAPWISVTPRKKRRRRTFGETLNTLFLMLVLHGASL